MFPIFLIDDVDGSEVSVPGIVSWCSCLTPEVEDLLRPRGLLPMRVVVFYADAEWHGIDSGEGMCYILVWAHGILWRGIWVPFDLAVSGVPGPLMSLCGVVSRKSLRVLSPAL